jgi:hypothetical protein
MAIIKFSRLCDQKRKTLFKTSERCFATQTTSKSDLLHRIYAMVNRRISEDVEHSNPGIMVGIWRISVRYSVVFQRAVANSLSSLPCWRWIFDEFGTVKKPPSPLVGRTRIIIRALMTAAENLFAEHSDLFLDEVCTWLAFQHNITIPSTLSRKCARLTDVFVRGDRSPCAAMTIDASQSCEVRNVHCNIP